MPHISTGGVSNQIVDPDFIAEPGTPMEKAIDEGLPNVNGVEDTDEDTEQPKPDKDSWDPARKNEPDNQTPAFEPKKSTPAKKK